MTTEAAAPIDLISEHVERRRVADLVPYAQNSRLHSDAQVEALAAAFRYYGFTIPILVGEDGLIIAGHGRVMAAKLCGMEEVTAIVARGWSDEKIRAYVIWDNRSAEQASWDLGVLRAEVGDLRDGGFDLGLIGFDIADLPGLGLDVGDGLSSGAGNDGKGAGSLRDKFGVPPFSVLNAREGWWQDRKRAWIALGIKSELGRGEGATYSTEQIVEPGLNYYRNRSKAFADGAVKGAGKGGLADQVAAAATARKANGRGKGRAFSQDLGKGEHVVGETAGQAQHRAGVFKGGTPDTARDSQFYAKKRATERVLGRELSIEEFRASFYVPDDAPTAMGTSIFDPVLCELAYRWFCPPGGTVLDPFAGGSVRGIVAGVLGRRYVGIELRAEQVVANRIQAELIFPDAADGTPHPFKPVWIAGDSSRVLGPDGDAADLVADFVFSCPPYADLEIYSDDPADLSNMPYPEFRAAYDRIIALACDRLAQDRFGLFVVGDVRDGAGNYRRFVGHTEEAFEAAGLSLYNEAILVTAAGSLPIRAGRQFAASRKLGKTHQNVLGFVKGDGAAASKHVGQVEFGDIPATEFAPEGADEAG